MVESLKSEHDAITAACVRHSVVRLEAFGSALRDDFVPGQSDVDLLVEFEPLESYALVDAYFGLLDELRSLLGKVDLVIPRGGESLIRAVVEQARVPVIKHYKGVCHIYVDRAANQEMALKIIDNAKCQRPGTCNAAEKVLIHRDLAATFAPRLAKLFHQRQVEMRGDPAFGQLVPEAKPATAADWTTEYLDLIITVAVVDSLDAAVAHITTYGSAHSDAIITQDKDAAMRFTEQVDSAAVYVNASTRFTDGGQFGMGAEIGISTDRIHARGPMGLEELTSYKYIVLGNGQIRA
ncbi:MAG: glutamate-5-semialdehyde dehydrogenase [bacterium]